MSRVSLKLGHSTCTRLAGADRVAFARHPLASFGYNVGDPRPSGEP